MPRKASDPCCPACGGRLDIVTDGLIGRTVHPGYHVRGTELPIVLVPAPFAACSSCEFCIEIIERPHHGKR